MVSESEFKDLVKLYTELEDELEKGSKTMSALRKKKTEMSATILDFMVRNDLEQVNFGPHQLKRTKSKTVEQLKKDKLAEELARALGDAAAANQVAEAIFSNRAVVEKEVLKKGRSSRSNSD